MKSGMARSGKVASPPKIVWIRVVIGHVSAEQGVDQGAAAQGHDDRRGDAQQHDEGEDEDDHWASPFRAEPEEDQELLQGEEEHDEEARRKRGVGMLITSPMAGEV